MHIQSIVGTNIKGKTFTHQLSPITLFLGDNAVGKTARLDAIRIFLLGYLPRLGVTPRSTFKLAGRKYSNMIVEATADDGRSSNRTWLLLGEDKVTLETIPVPTPFGIVPAILIDASEYLALSPNKRVEYVFTNIRSSTALDGHKLIADVRALTFDEDTPDVREAITELVTSLNKSYTTFTQTSVEDATVTFQSWLDAVIEKLQDEARVQRDTIDRMSKSVQAGVQLETLPAGDMNNLEAERDRSVAQLQEIDNMLATQQEQSRAALESNNRRSEIERRLAAIPEPAMDASIDLLAATKEELLAKQQSLADCQAAVTTASKTFGAQMAASSRRKLLKDRAAILTPRIAGLQSNQVEIDSLFTASKNYTPRTNELLALQASIQNRLIEVRREVTGLESGLVLCDAKYSQLLTAGKCPVCKHAGSGFESAIREMGQTESDAIAKRLSKANETMQSLVDSEAQLKSNLEVCRASDVEHANRERRISALRQLIQALLVENQELKGITTELASGQDIDVAMIQFEKTGAEREYATAYEAERGCRSLLASIESSLELTRKRDAIRSTLNDLPLVAVPLVDPALAARRSEVQSHIDLRNTEIKRAAAARQSEIFRQRAVAEMAAATARQEVFRKSLNLLRAYRADLVTLLFKPIIEAANRIVNPVLGKSLVEQKGVVGFKTDAGIIPSELFSGTEDAVMQAALGLALAAQCKFKLVIFDELGRLSVKNKQALLGSVEELIKDGTIDQFFGVDVDDGPYAPFAGRDGFSLITVK